ncbi:MAG: dTDP-4-dehydrorhamnose 3,5-epimerase [Candidatus Auribacterota bacterium]|nr:dTDP-4-dehydrorhamnose 3,5-epimerase [Candidatus Auribacterota bacterium]
MKFSETELDGVWIITPELREDQRGFFARTFSREEFASQGLNPDYLQDSISFNHKKGTLRGIHYQIEPAREIKLVSCPRGAIFDVVIDIRRESSTYGQTVQVRLDADEYKMLYIPEGCAHGFQTLEDDTLVYYQISELHHPELARGLRWDDPAFEIKWPLSPTVMSEKDKNYNNWMNFVI